MSGQENQNGERGTIAMVVKDRKGRWDTLVDRGRVVGIRLPCAVAAHVSSTFSCRHGFRHVDAGLFLGG